MLDQSKSFLWLVEPLKSIFQVWTSRATSSPGSTWLVFDKQFHINTKWDLSISSLLNFWVLLLSADLFSFLILRAFNFNVYFIYICVYFTFFSILIPLIISPSYNILDCSISNIHLLQHSNIIAWLLVKFTTQRCFSGSYFYFVFSCKRNWCSIQQGDN